MHVNKNKYTDFLLALGTYIFTAAPSHSRNIPLDYQPSLEPLDDGHADITAFVEALASVSIAAYAGSELQETVHDVEISTVDNSLNARSSSRNRSEHADSEPQQVKSIRRSVPGVASNSPLNRVPAAQVFIDDTFYGKISIADHGLTPTRLDTTSSDFAVASFLCSPLDGCPGDDSYNYYETGTWRVRVSNSVAALKIPTEARNANVLL